MVFLPLLLLWLRDPLYFNRPSRWAAVLLALAIGFGDTQTLAEPPQAGAPVLLCREVGGA